LNKTQILQH